MSPCLGQNEQAGGPASQPVLADAKGQIQGNSKHRVYLLAGGLDKLTEECNHEVIDEIAVLFIDENTE